MPSKAYSHPEERPTGASRRTHHACPAQFLFFHTLESGNPVVTECDSWSRDPCLPEGVTIGLMVLEHTNGHPNRAPAICSALLSRSPRLRLEGAYN